ncbi:hypothetical protein DERF_008484 [Dermatophagoides farinae]|uniref:C2H2-type domain-containing protein n=1 Tax=Dermatophagoides farinae TaxID=6954 RepID=A0A922I5T6_DERFA|nr:hypothetical protein DERF_008484 [Dermatophagoides farinae]
MANVTNKINFLESENKLLMDQQQNYKELCKILTQRHVEILKYLNHLRNMVEKMISVSKENVLYANYYTEKSSYETNILKYDKQIQFLTESIQSSHTRISDNEGNLFKEHLKLLSTSLVDSSSPKNTAQTFQQLESSNIQNQQQQQQQQLQPQQHTVVVYHSGDFTNAQEIISQEYFKKDLSTEIKMNDDSVGGGGGGSIFVPKMNNSTYPIMANNNTVAIITTTTAAAAAATTTTTNNIAANSKKLEICEYCGKYFNKHYLASHKRSHTGDRPYICSINGCNRKFTQTSSRNVHEKRVHNNNNNNVHQQQQLQQQQQQQQHGKLEFRCTYCDAGFDNLTDMQKHAQQHQALINNNVVTQQQQQQQQFDQIPVITVPNIKINSNSNNNNNGISQTVKRTRKSGLIVTTNGQNNNGTKKTSTTLQSINPNGYRHVCQHCGKAFAYKVAMKQHMALHGPKNFRCTYNDCNYASYWKHNLALHIRKHHQPTSTSSTSTSSSSSLGLTTTTTTTATPVTTLSTTITSSSSSSSMATNLAN